MIKEKEINCCFTHAFNLKSICFREEICHILDCSQMQPVEFMLPHQKDTRGLGGAVLGNNPLGENIRRRLMEAKI
jgi:hypothetical protein